MALLSVAPLSVPSLNSKQSGRAAASCGAVAAKWGLAALGCAIIGVLAWMCMFALYFELLQDECRGSFDILSGTVIEAAIGALPIWARNLLLSQTFFKVAKKVNVRRRSALGLLVACLLGAGLSLWSFEGSSSKSRALLIIGGSFVFTICTFAAREACHRASGFTHGSGLVEMLLLGSTVGAVERAGWLAIVDDGQVPQHTWHEARDARKLTQRQAVASAATRLLMWHWSQPLAYLWVLRVYRCYVAALGSTQIYLATIVAAREVIYLGSTVLALTACPVFLLLDPITIWHESENYSQCCVRVAAYVLTPHNYVAFCLAKRFATSWSNRLYLGLAGIQVVADLASCFALGALLASGIQSELQAPTALVIGYVITASSFVLFFGPLMVVNSFHSATDNRKRCGLRVVFGVAGLVLLCALLCLVVLFGTLMGTSFNPYCAVLSFQHDRCSTHGVCYGAGQCRCTVGFGPEISYTGEALCSKPGMPCTGGQLVRALESTDAKAPQVCCAHRGTLFESGCRCAAGYGPQVPDNDLTPTIALCSIECYDPLTRARSTCSDHGTCNAATNGTCVCQTGWGGVDCSARFVGLPLF